MNQEGNPAKRIIVMEDEPTIRGIVVKQLQNRGYRADGARDGEGALDLFSRVVDEGAVDRCLLILDLVVPSGLGGAETLARAQDLAPGVKAIIASGLTDEEDLEALVVPGRVDMLSKPYDMKELLSKVEHMLGP